MRERERVRIVVVAGMRRREEEAGGRQQEATGGVDREETVGLVAWQRWA